MAEFLDNFANPASLAQAWPLLWQGLQLTLLLAVVALPLAFAAGLLLAGTWSLRLRGLSSAIVALIDVLRSFPVLVLLILIFYGLPFLGLRLPNFGAAVLALVLNNAGYFGEILRAGIAGVPAGQGDALRALGLTRLQGLRLVVLPQAVQSVLAPLASNALELVKATSVGPAGAAALRPGRAGTDLRPDPSDGRGRDVLRAAVALRAAHGAPGTAHDGAPTMRGCGRPLHSAVDASAAGRGTHQRSDAPVLARRLGHGGTPHWRRTLCRPARSRITRRPPLCSPTRIVQPEIAPVCWPSRALRGS